MLIDCIRITFRIKVKGKDKNFALLCEILNLAYVLISQVCTSNRYYSGTRESAGNILYSRLDSVCGFDFEKVR